MMEAARKHDFPEEGVVGIDIEETPLPILFASVNLNVSPPIPTHTAAIALGSNLGDRFANIETALRLIEHPNQLLVDIGDAAAVSVVNTSFMYETAPMYVTDQPRFANCACLVSLFIQYFVSDVA
jgi:dihydroneopterin aldolase/2-amino-4-hydroxy-6-hydroxymethyldihydropteridine diphosphokinase/dihydropteroate synthase